VYGGGGRSLRQVGTMCESTAAEAVDDMQRINVADRMKHGKRPTDGGGATHTKGPHKSGPPYRGPHKAANRRPQRDPNRKHTDGKEEGKVTASPGPPPPRLRGGNQQKHRTGGRGNTSRRGLCLESIWFHRSNTRPSVEPERHHTGCERDTAGEGEG